MAGRNFDCSKCSEDIAAARRCKTPRWDHKSEESSIFPIAIVKGGATYGFCPGKAMTDYQTVKIYRILSLAAETGALLNSGGIVDQPSWFIEMLTWFIPVYDGAKFSSKAYMILGDGDDKKKKNRSSLSGGRKIGR